MKTTLATIAALLFVSPAFAVSPEQVKACETQLREKNKADNAAAPEGYKVKREKGFRQTYLADCLSK